jgi:thioredoxin 1
VMTIDAPIHTNEANLSRVLGAGLPVVLVFWRRDCAPCDQLMPVLDRLAHSYSGRALVVKINAGEEPALASRYHVTNVPTLVFIKDSRPIATAVGAAGEMELTGWLNHLSSGGSRPPVPGGPSQPLQTGSRASAQPPPRPSGAGASSQSSRPSGNGQGHPVVLTDSSFDRVVRSSQGPVLVDFWAEWCGPCRMVAPVVEQLAQEYNGRAVVGKVNVDENPGIASRYGIMSIPTLLIFRNGQIVDRIVGAQPGPVIRQKLAQQVQS